MAVSIEQAKTEDMTMVTRAVAYARFSSDQQSDKSCDDQFREVDRLAARDGYEIVERYQDKAISGALFDQRPGIQTLLDRVRRGDVEAVLAEALDRISRDQEHVAHIYKKLAFWGTKLITIAEGEISELHIGLKGTMSALYLKDLAQKTHRGLKGRALAGFSCGGKIFGYKLTREKDGSRYVVDDAQAATVVEIFKLFASGKSPLGIATELNRRGVPSPSGKSWSSSTIYGQPDLYTGMLANEIYMGRIIWNRRQWRKDPTTGKSVSRLRDPSEWVIVDQPELSIVDERLWQATQRRLREVAAKAPDGKKAKKRSGRYPLHLLSGLLRCSECHSAYTLINSEQYGCTRRANQGLEACSNNRTVRRTVVEEAVLTALRDDVFTLEGVQHAEAIMRKRLLARSREQNSQQKDAKRALDRVEAEINNLLTAIKAGIFTPSTRIELERLEREKERLAALLKVETVDFADVQKFLPKAIAEYRRVIMTLTTVGMTAETTRARQAISDLVGGEIILEPSPKGGLNAILRGDYNAMLQLARRKSEGRKTSVFCGPRSRVARGGTPARPSVTFGEAR
jgi:DNA invertase Pin-like site-specific DNA recombinase